MKKSSEKASEVLLKNYDQVKAVFKSYQVNEVRIFGSVASLKDNENSDVDFLVDLDKSSSLLDFGMLKTDIEDVLKRKVDMLTYAGLDQPVLEFFKKDSISFDKLKKLTEENAVKSHVTSSEKQRLNLNSMKWVIDRLLVQVTDVSFETYMTDEVLKDATTRNLQLLGQVSYQLLQVDQPFSHLDLSLIKGLVTLKESLFLNVDHQLVWFMVTRELEKLKSDIVLELEVAK
ncbi:hypothetical protein EZV73_01035 [Acidaminobacter sp. JC074]|uniref:nucleotidyltransferase family protein n=1 Tax=Acidaminobacter sp. JC074 TaxID=2530199 RepID=UPI001F0F5C1A|nr:nucleotidyltransferase domain-containing protein [Acidaminobacter sp. JC074]MCH4886126.1 hypothetical protein [Acidaminobacter sp. JC074]